MGRRAFLVTTILLHAAAAARAQPADLTPLLTKTTFSADDVLPITTFLEDRARRLGTAKTQKQRDDVKATVLKWVEDPKASPEFKGVYAREYGKAFRSLIASQDFDLAFAAAMMLDAMRVPAAVDGLITGLASRHAAVRYLAAKGLAELRPALKTPAESTPVLQALGAAGAAESDTYVLRLIYVAVDFDAAGAGFTGHDEVARALMATLGARLATLRGGGRRDDIDQPAFALAARVYPKLTSAGDLQKELVLTLARFLALDAARYAQLGPKGGGIGFKDSARACEDALASIVAAGGGTPPPVPQRVATRIAAGADVKSVQQALSAWIGAADKPGVLNGDPWNLPIGLTE
jgi:hypothetical protein